MRTKIAFVGVALVSIALILVACNSQGNVTATPAGAAAAASVIAGCTPTPAVRPPTFTVAPAERNTPYAAITVIARYQATYPGDVVGPTRTTDLAPQVAQRDKVTIVVRHANCTYDYYYLTSDQIAGFRAALPPGDTIFASAPPESLMGQHPTLAPQPSGAAPGVGFDRNGNKVTPVPPSGTQIAPPPAALQTAEAAAEATRLGGFSRTPIVPTPSR